MRHWSDDIRSLADMVAHKDAFLADPGGVIDFEAIGDGMDGSVPEDEVLGTWFDRTAERLSTASFVLHRQMSVADVGAFVDGLRDGSLEPGDHWSLKAYTESPSPDMAAHDVTLTATVERDHVDWFTTFQSFFVHPWEQEVVFRGKACLQRLVETGTGEEHAFAETAFAP